MIARTLAAASLVVLLTGSDISSASDEKADDRGYRQAAVSVPLKSTSDGGEGHPWRLLYGYPLLQRGRFSVQQDWVISYLDAKPIRGAEGGTGIGVGTDFAIRWQLTRRTPFSTYLELGNGVQYAARTAFPAHGSRWQITTNVGIGVLRPIREKRQLSAAIRYLHMSNGGLSDDNAGYDAMHLVIGMKFGR